MKKATNEQLVKSYQKTNSIWVTAKEFGMCGQSVWERLKKLNKLNKKKTHNAPNMFSEKEKEYLKRHYLKYRDMEKLDDLSKIMNKTKQFLCRKAKDLGLTDISHKKSEEHCKKRGDCQKKYLATHEHPRGYKGHKHSKETRKILGDKCRNAWTDKSSVFNSKLFKQKQSDNSSKRMIKRLKEHPNSVYSHCKRGWWENGKKKYFMRSKWEMNYACYLDFLIKHKQIKDWEYEAETFWFNKIKRGVRSYTPDFLIYNNNRTIEYHEVKGFMDAKSKTKLNRMRIYYPKIKMVVIDSERYKEIKKQSGLFKGWQ